MTHANVPATDDREQTLARKQSNLAFAFAVAGLDKRRVRAMEVLYTFCRVADDIVDAPAGTAGGTDAQKRAALDKWRETVNGFFAPPRSAPTAPRSPLADELAAVVREFAIPREPLLEILDGCGMDIAHAGYADAAALHRYCHGVASAVGLCSLPVFGATASPVTREFAVALGYALQFTNILRDVVEDARDLGRVYLPRDEMAAFGVEAADLSDPENSPRAADCRRLFALQYLRARHYFNKARRLVVDADAPALRAAFLMGAFYEALLEKIRAGGFRLTGARTRLSKWEKLTLVRRELRARGGWGGGWRGKGGGQWPVVSGQCDGGAGVSRPRRVVVIGGGVAGIAAAAEATLAGDDVVLLEARPLLGGRASSFRARTTETPDTLPHSPLLDHGHHAIFGCYRAFFHLARILGVEWKLRPAAPLLDITYYSPAAGTAGTTTAAAESIPHSPFPIPHSSRLRAARLPAPLHLLAALARFGELRWRDRLAILRFAAKFRLGLAAPAAGETAAAWLDRHRQTPAAVRALWEPFCVAALNEPPAAGDAALLAATLRRTLFGTAGDSVIWESAVPLAELFAPEMELALRATGGELRTRARVAALENSTTGGVKKITAAILADGSRVAGDVFILAAGWREAARLLPSPPAFAALRPRPILNIHLFADPASPPLFPQPFAALLDSPVQWVFASGERSAVGDRRPRHYALTLSTPPADWLALPSAALLERAKAELARFFPAAFAKVRFTGGVVCKCPDATFDATPAAAPRPAADALSAGDAASFANLLLAGDYTATGLPATLEGAAQSGLAAARASAAGCDGTIRQGQASGKR